VEGDGGGVVLDARDQLPPLQPVDDDAERHLEDDEHEHRDRQVADQKTTDHDAGCSLNPTPRTVSIHPGSPSFFRMDATCTSRVFVGPYHGCPHTRSMMFCLSNTAPGSWASRARRSNSLGVSSTSAPDNVTRRVRRSISRLPILGDT